MRSRKPHHDSDGTGRDERSPGLLEVARSVGAAFFGVQSEANRRRDFTHGRPIHYIVVGAVATVVFVLALIAIVRVILASAGV